MLWATTALPLTTRLRSYFEDGIHCFINGCNAAKAVCRTGEMAAPKPPHVLEVDARAEH